MKQSKYTITNKSRSKTTNEDDEDDKPIPYSTSPAAQWQARFSQAGHKDDSPWFEPWIVAFSMSAFLIYFLYMRKPNDIDQIFDRELGDYFPDHEYEKLKKTVVNGPYPEKPKRN